MSYSATGIIAAVTLLIINFDVLFRRKSNASAAVGKHYRMFIISILIYYATDILWGYLDRFKLIPLLYADTVIYFLAMAMGIWFWTYYVIVFIGEKKLSGVILKYTGRIFVTLELVFVIVNFFKPILFSFDENGNYVAGPARYVTLGVQVVLFFLTAIHSTVSSVKSNGALKNRYRTIALFGIAMTVLISIQLFYPLLPLYSVGYMLGNCLLYVFVIQDEKEEYRRELEDALIRERKHQKELGSTRKLAYTDPLTGVRNKLAYAEAEDRIQKRINAGEAVAFAIAVFDLNDLKHINDTQGHDAGDRYLCEACSAICKRFKHSPVFRIGGDEFVAVLEGEDYENRFELMKQIDRQSEENLRYGGAVVSAGMAQFDPGEDEDTMTVFKRADLKMYDRKIELKKMGSAVRE